jgi:hypothetical protein
MTYQLVNSSICCGATGHLYLQDLSSPRRVAVPEKYACNSKQCIQLQNINIPFTEFRYMNHNIREVNETKFHLNMNREDVSCLEQVIETTHSCLKKKGGLLMTT